MPLQFNPRILPQFHLVFAAMLPTPRSVAISLALLWGVAHSLQAQTVPTLTAGSVFYLKERVAVKTKLASMPLRRVLAFVWFLKMEMHVASPMEQQRSMSRRKN